jgi:transcription initiation factor TFIID TATA-box-binding protein
MVKIKIENMVATTLLCKKLDLPSLSKSIEGAQYDTDRFPGLILRIINPKASILLFGSGKVVCTGAKNHDEVRAAIDQLVKQMEAIGVPVTRKPEIIVQNIVATVNLGCVINLNAIAVTLSLEKVEYEPEQFPGLVYRLDSPKVVMLLFGSGKMVCTGARKTEDIELAVERITRELSDAGLLR